MKIEGYTHTRYLEYEHKRKRIQFTILTKEVVDYQKLRHMVFVDYQNYINLHMSKKVSKNNIVKFLNENGIDCIIKK